jgi:hypothetical protein
MMRELKIRTISAQLIQLKFDVQTITLTFIDDLTGIEFVEELDLLDNHDVFRFSMFLESFHIKDLKKANKMLNMMIESKVHIPLVVDQRNEILYSNMLNKEQTHEIKKHILLEKLIDKKKITKEMYEEMKDMSYSEVRSIVK